MNAAGRIVSAPEEGYKLQPPTYSVEAYNNAYFQ